VKIVDAKDLDNVPSVPVSVLVCAHNELENLKRLIPAILGQRYKNFELLLVDDRSTDGSFAYFKDKYQAETRFRIIRIEEKKANENFKKNALTKAIEVSEFDTLLITDADCIPSSEYWIAEMASFLNSSKIEIVLGYSPYEYRSGFLNMLIRYETLMTAVHYFSFALSGFPYMGVGRNLMYKKSLFKKNQGFKTHINITGGDDDLFIGEVGKSTNTACCMHKNGQMISIPKENYFSWLRQKRRHLSVGVKYKWRHQALLGLEIFSHVFFYVFAGIVFCQDYKAAFFFLMIRSLVFVVIFVLIAKKLGDNYKWWWLLFPLDVVYIFNYLLITLSLVLYKKIKWS
jgi:glycosyltransferase involved in cell wall biosynthesis